MASSPDIATLSIDDFEPHLNATFELNSPGALFGPAGHRAGAHHIASISRQMIAPSAPAHRMMAASAWTAKPRPRLAAACE